MTLFGWDASHYDGPLSRVILQRAYTEDLIRLFTHKVGEGLQDTEKQMDDTALGAAKDIFPFVGGYLVPRTLDTATQIDFWWNLLNQGEPWWRDFPGYFNQIDLEKWPYDPVSAAVGIDCAKRWRDKTQRETLLYASHSQYPDTLGSWDGPLWNADYVNSDVYPGDNWQPNHGGWFGGWTPYGDIVKPKAPAVLQFTSSATIAGLTTCDKNAFRGTEDDFRKLIGGTMTLNENDINQAASVVIWNLRPWTVDAINAIGRIEAVVTALGKGMLSQEDLDNIKAQATAAVSAGLTQYVDTLAKKTADALVASGANGLTQADHPGIVADVKQALREGIGTSPTGPG